MGGDSKTFIRVNGKGEVTCSQEEKRRRGKQSGRRNEKILTGLSKLLGHNCSDRVGQNNTKTYSTSTLQDCICLAES